MVVIFTVSVGGCHYLIEGQKSGFKEAASTGAAGEQMVIPGGMPVGIYLETKGVMVLGTDKIEGMDGMSYEPSEHLIKAGDYITGIDGLEVGDKQELLRAIGKLKREEVVLRVRRNQRALNIRTKAVEWKPDKYKLGIWVRDNAQGLGTITYLDSDSRFGALGHGIHDMDTNMLLNIQEGTLYVTSIKDIQKGEHGIPGGMEGIIVYNNYNILGSIEKNTEAGIFGRLDTINALFHDQTPVKTAKKREVRKGPAVIRCAVEGKVKEYKVEITKTNPATGELNKGIEIQITDEKLLEVTGGIVQGMSGSPILQDGKLVGAVTHVFVNDPAKGYGIFIENMLEEMNK